MVVWSRLLILFNTLSLFCFLLVKCSVTQRIINSFFVRFDLFFFKGGSLTHARSTVLVGSCRIKIGHFLEETVPTSVALIEKALPLVWNGRPIVLLTTSAPQICIWGSHRLYKLSMAVRSSSEWLFDNFLLVDLFENELSIWYNLVKLFVVHFNNFVDKFPLGSSVA